MPDRPLLVYDAECAFCVEWIERWKRVTGDRVAFAPFQNVAREHPEIPLERFRESVHLLDTSGNWSRGAEAVLRSIEAVPGHGGWIRLYLRVPPFAGACEWIYRLVAQNRGAIGRLTGARRGG